MQSKQEYVILLSNVIANTFMVCRNKHHGYVDIIKGELKRILLQTDFDNTDGIYEHILDFFSRTNTDMYPEDIEELARITQLSVNSSIAEFMCTELTELW